MITKEVNQGALLFRSNYLSDNTPVSIINILATKAITNII